MLIILFCSLCHYNMRSNWMDIWCLFTYFHRGIEFPCVNMSSIFLCPQGNGYLSHCIFKYENNCALNNALQFLWEYVQNVFDLYFEKIDCPSSVLLLVANMSFQNIRYQFKESFTTLAVLHPTFSLSLFSFFSPWRYLPVHQEYIHLISATE